MFLLMFFALTSCSNIGKSVFIPSVLPTLSQTTEAITNPSPTATVSLTHTPTDHKTSAVSVPVATSILADYLKDLKQVTDKELKVLIEEPDQKCHKPGEFIPIMITYQNLTDKPLIIADYNIVAANAVTSYGAVFPVLTTTNNEEIIFAYDYMGDKITFIDFVLLREIPQKSSFEVLVDYYLPTGGVGIAKTQNFSVLPPGQYILQFLYATREFQDIPTPWSQKMASNQIMICAID